MFYQLNKGEDYDVNGDNLRDWIDIFSSDLTDITLEDTGAATIENMSDIFVGCTNLTSVDLSNFNTSNVTSTYQMFSYCNHLATIPNFNTSKVTNMSYMFSRCFNTISIANFDTSNVTNMSCMFNSCRNLSNISNYNTSKVTDMSYMFGRCNNLTTVPNFNTNNVTNMCRMFQYCTNITDVPQFSTPNAVVNISGMFEYCNNLSNTSIQNIINICLNSNISSGMRNLYTNNQYSPLRYTKFDSSYYSNRLTDLTNAGWVFEPYTGGETSAGDLDF